MPKIFVNKYPCGARKSRELTKRLDHYNSCDNTDCKAKAAGLQNTLKLFQKDQDHDDAS